MIILMYSVECCRCAATLLFCLLFFFSHHPYCVGARILKAPAAECGFAQQTSHQSSIVASAQFHEIDEVQSMLECRKTRRFHEQQKLTHFISLPKGRNQYQSGANPGHNDATIENQKSRSSQLIEDERLISTSILVPKESSISLGSKLTHPLDDVLNRVALPAGDTLAINQLPKGQKPGSGPNPIHN